VVDNANDFRRVSASTCASIARFDDTGNGGGIVYNFVNDTVDHIERKPLAPFTSWTRTGFDPTDATDPIAIILPETDLGHFEITPDARRVNAVRNRVSLDASGNYIVCGQSTSSTGGAPTRGHVFKASQDWTTVLWNITFTDSTDGTVRDCVIGPSGEIIVALEAAGTSPNRVAVKKYCCNSESAFKATVPQVDFETQDGDGGGAVIDLQEQCATIGDAFGIGTFGCNLAMTGIFILGMGLFSGGAAAALTRGRALVLLAVAFAVGSVVGLIFAWALGFATGLTIFVITMIAIVLIGLLFLIRRGG
jgi:hypothetical protein